MKKQLLIIPSILFLLILLALFYLLIIERNPSELPSNLLNKNVPKFETESLLKDKKFISPNDFENQIVTSGSFNVGQDLIQGFTAGNSVKVRVWKNDENVDIDATIDSWTTTQGDAVAVEFESLAIRVLDTNVYPPSSIGLFPSPESW